MKAFLDGRAIEAKPATLAGAIAAGARIAEGEGRIIVEVLLDGRAVTGEALERPSDEPLENSEVRLASADPRSLAAEAIGDARTQLEFARARQSRCAALIQAGEMSEAMGLMQECLADWQAAQAVTSSVAQLIDVKPDDQAVNELAGRLEEVKGALAGQDWATLADLLAYDMDEQAHNWIAMFDRLRDAVKQ